MILFGRVSMLAPLGSALFLVIALGHAAPVRSSELQGDMSGMHHMKMNSAGTPAARAYGKIMDRMHEPMMAAIAESDPDFAFVRGMIPHHQGAVEMAE